MTQEPRPLGDAIEFVPAAAPSLGTVLSGQYVVLRPLDPAGDVQKLYAISHPTDGDTSIWMYLPEGPYDDVAAMAAALEARAASTDPLFFAIVPCAEQVARGVCSYLRITPAHGVIEIGHIWFAPSLQRSTAATEAIYLLARHAFDELGYRRLEWKCDALNARSRRAARRFGFRFEGVFEQHMVIGTDPPRNRDTAWFAITDRRWPAVRAAFETWLDPSNFDGDGQQRLRLADLT